MKSNFKTKIILAIVIVAMLITVSTGVFAADENNYSVAMALTSSSKLKEGDIVTVKVNLTSINAGNGIDTITAKLNYDEDVFETLQTTDITAGDNWTPSYAASTKMLTVLKNEKVTAAENVLTINFKVKAAINVNSTTISLQEIVVSGGRVVDGGTGDITVNNASVTISKENVTPTIVNTTVTTTNTTSKDNTVTKTATLPKTGIEQYGIIAIVVVAIIAVSTYVVYKKIAKEVK